MSNNDDGGRKASHGAYAPERRTRSVAKTLAECDALQAKQIGEWAERIRKNAIEPVDAHDLMQLANEMKNVAFVVEAFTTEILEKLRDVPASSALDRHAILGELATLRVLFTEPGAVSRTGDLQRGRELCDRIKTIVLGEHKR